MLIESAKSPLEEEFSRTRDDDRRLAELAGSGLRGRGHGPSPAPRF
jgi:hypothetical protein